VGKCGNKWVCFPPTQTHSHMSSKFADYQHIKLSLLRNFIRL